MLVLGYADYRTQARQLAQALNLPYREVELHRFPDGESKVTLPDRLPKQIYLYRSLDHPNDKLVELHLSCHTARALGVEHITLVAPYLCYMRQDIAFHPGEAVSQMIIGRWLGEIADAIVTVDPHLHRIARLGDAIPNARATALSAAPLVSDFFRSLAEAPLLIGPDRESAQWVSAIAERAGLEWTIATKTRSGDYQVDIQLPECDVAHRAVVIIDDMASTGRTLANTTQRIRQLGARSVDCFITHPLFVGHALDELRNAGARHVWSSDSITHPTNQVALAPLLARAIQNNIRHG